MLHSDVNPRKFKNDRKKFVSSFVNTVPCLFVKVVILAFFLCFLLVFFKQRLFLEIGRNDSVEVTASLLELKTRVRILPWKMAPQHSA